MVKQQMNNTKKESAGDRKDAESDISTLARMFFNAVTKLSENAEDILPQEDSEELRMSVFTAFAELFPEAVGNEGSAGGNKRMRLHFNQVGYSMYGKEQSRRVPAVRAKPGNPGYGFRRARWRDTLRDEQDGRHCEAVLRDGGYDQDKIERIKARVQELGSTWDAIRRPSRPAGPGRPRRAVLSISMPLCAKKENGSPEMSVAGVGSSSGPALDGEMLTKRTKQALNPSKSVALSTPSASGKPGTRALTTYSWASLCSAGKRVRDNAMCKPPVCTELDFMQPAFKMPKRELQIIGESSTSDPLWASDDKLEDDANCMDNLHLFAAVAAAQKISN